MVMHIASNLDALIVLTVGQMFWMWLAALTSFLLYIPVAVVTYKSSRRDPDTDGASSNDEKREDANIVAQMLLYARILCIWSVAHSLWTL